MELIFKIRDSGLAVVVIEHDMRFIFNLCDRVLCLVQGETLVEGTPGEVQSDPRVIEAYIGTGDEDDDRGRGGRRASARQSEAAEVPGRGPSATPPIPGARGGRTAVTACSRSRTCGSPTARSRPSRASPSRSTQGQVVTLIGTNGAGKTTTLRTISGLLRPDVGEIRFEGKPIDRDPRTPDRRPAAWPTAPRAGRIFPRLTVEENLLLGAFPARTSRHQPGPRTRLTTSSPSCGSDVRRPRRHVLRRRAADAGDRPRADEPAQAADARRAVDGPLADHDADASCRRSSNCSPQGTTILLVEQNAPAALSLADYGYVLEVGKIVLENTGKALLVDENVRKVYLGEE